MGFAGKQNLHGTLDIIEDAPQALDVPQHKSRALVGGEAAGEADGQRIRVEDFVGRVDFRPGRPAALELQPQMPPGECHQAHPAALVGSPQFLGRNALHALPQFRIGVHPPVRPQVAVVQLVHFERNPGAKMHAVGDVADGNLILRDTRPDGLPHLSGDLSVQLADSVAGGRHAQRQHRHAELFGVVGRILPAERQELAAADPQPADVIPEVTVHQGSAESNRGRPAPVCGR